MGKVILFNGITTLDLPVDRVLEKAIGKLDGGVVLGFDNDGKFYAASSYADGGTVMWLLEQCKHNLLAAEAMIREEEEMKDNPQGQTPPRTVHMEDWGPSTAKPVNWDPNGEPLIVPDMGPQTRDDTPRTLFPLQRGKE